MKDWQTNIIAYEVESRVIKNLIEMRKKENSWVVRLGYKEEEKFIIR